MEKIFFCKQCVMSNQKVIPSVMTADVPSHENRSNIRFKEGICSACLEIDKKFTSTDWKKREFELNKFLEKYRSRNGSFDCIVPGSGGKDSVFQAYILKSKYKMNPLTVTFSPHMYTDVGMSNFHKWPLNGDVQNFLFTPSGRVHSKLTELAFKNLLHPFQPFIFGQKYFAVNMAHLLKIPLIFYGESQSEAGGQEDEEEQFKMLHRYYTKEKDDKILVSGYNLHELEKDHKITSNDLRFYLPIEKKIAVENDISIVYLGHFEKFDPQENYYLAAKHTDYKPNTQRTEQTFSKYSSIDDKVDPFHFYTQYVKWGYGRCTEEASNEIRHKHITREEGVKLVHKYDHEFPKTHFKDFLNYIKTSEEEFYDTLDKFRPNNLWERTGNDPQYCKNWKLKYKVS